MREVSVRRGERVDEDIHQAVLDDGMPVRVIPKPGYQKKFAVLVADYGSIDTAFVAPGEDAPSRCPEGVAHFLEHKLFEDEAGDVFDQFARYGASANAYTSYTETAYHFTAAEHFEECLELLLDFVARPFFTEEQIEKERRVIAQEIRMYEDSPGAAGHLALLQALYHEHPVRLDIPGTVASIAEIDKALLERCHRAFYRPDNMLLVVSGDVDPAAVFAQAEANAARRYGDAGPPPPGAPIRRVAAQEPSSVRGRRTERRMAVSLPRLLVGAKLAPVAPGVAQVRFQREVGFLLDLLFGRSSRFFETHCATGLIDDTFGASIDLGRGGFAHLVIGGESPEPDRLVEALDAEVARAAADGLDEQDFLRLRNKAWGRYIRSFNALEAVASGEADAALQGWDILRYLELLESITLADVQAHLGPLFDPEQRAVSLVLPL